MTITNNPEVTEATLLASFRKHFPEHAARLDATTNDEQTRAVHAQLLDEAQEGLRRALVSAGLDASGADQQEGGGAVISLSAEQYTKLVGAHGGVIMNELQTMINSIQALKAMEEDDPARVTAQLLLAGVLGVVGIARVSIVQELAAGAAEGVAALAGVTVATVGVVVAVVTLVIVAILIPIIYFMKKPATCIMLVINETDQELTLNDVHNKHGKQAAIVTTLPKAVTVGDEKFVTSAIYAAEKRSNALVGTEWGLTFKGGAGPKFAFGADVPLTSAEKDNNCWCGFDVSASEAADMTDEKNQQTYVAQQDGYQLSIEVNDTSGAVAYYIARIIGPSN